MAFTHLSMKAKTRNGSQTAQRAVGYLLRETPETQTRKDLIWQQTNNLPEWAQNSSQFFSAAMAYERVNGRWGMSIQAMLPRELSREHQLELTNDFVKAHLSDKVYLVVLHEPLTATGEKQPHIHILFSERSVDGIERDELQYFKRGNREHPELGGQTKDRFWNERRCPGRMRQSWVDLTNFHLERAGHEARVDARSLYARGIERTPGNRTQTIDKEQLLAHEHWEQRKIILGITSVHDLTQEVIRDKSLTWAREGHPGRAIPPLSLGDIHSRQVFHERVINQQEVYAHRLHAEIMGEDQRQRSGMPSTRTDDTRIERLIEQVDHLPEPPQHDAKQLARERAIAGMDIVDDDTPRHGASWRMRDKQRGLGLRR